MQQTESPREQRQGSAFFGAILGVLLIPFLFIGACFAVPYASFVRWRQQRREQTLKSLMKSRGRFIGWKEFVRAMRETGGTCIEEKFSAKGPVRFWWTPENVHAESPHEIIDWFTMRKGGRFVPFVLWCRERYTAVDGGSAVLVETWGVSKKEIYALWAECRPQTHKARWIEVAPPEILPPNRSSFSQHARESLPE